MIHQRKHNTEMQNLIRRFLPLFAMVGFLTAYSLAQIPHSKREFRGAWIATVVNLDWPSGAGISVQNQKNELIALLDGLRNASINAVVFQVRPECDALYASPYEPWSYWLTGSQGTPPNPYYDPLEFAAAEAHKRGMEIHAWFNPYRAFRQTNTYARAANHVTIQHPDWVLTTPDNFKFLDPGRPEVRDFVSTVISDVVRRYNVDGVHMDDYFYPYAEHGFTSEDSTTFRIYRRGFGDNQRSDWRRDNVNLLIQQLYDSIQAIKPWVKMGMSPFGIWKSGVPQGIFGTSAYDALYCDAIAWLQAKSIDYLTPQLYWPFGGGQDYGLLSKWWSDSAAANGRHLYPGQGTYRIAAGWSLSEVSNQIIANRNNPNIQGSVHFRANMLRYNDYGITDHLKSGVYFYASAPPVMPWKETDPPNGPSGLASAPNPSTGIHTLSWQGPSAASDGDTAARYIVYRFNSGTVNPGDEENPMHLLGLTGEPVFIPPARVDSPGVQYSYAVSALDKNNNESPLSNVLQFSIPISAPTLALPADGEMFFTKTSPLRWNRAATSLVQRIQLSRGATFHPDSMVLDKSQSDSAVTPSGLAASTWYYWRVMAGNQAGSSEFSEVRSFRTGWPLPPTIVSPIAASNYSLSPTLVWNTAEATSYRVRVIDDVTKQAIVNTVVSDTTYTVAGPLQTYRIYTWNVSSINPYGESEWSTQGRFRTQTGTAVETDDIDAPLAFNLSQNYPNPFNNETTIRFALREEAKTILRVYDILGREVATLVDEVLPGGHYVSRFNANRLPTGAYIYVLVSGGNRMSGKLLLVK